MRRRLFFTGDMGVGKSTAIAEALGPALSSCGGFLTRRILDAQDRVQGFSLRTPDGSREQVFLDVSGEKPEIFLEVFDTLGISALQGRVLVLDEIGGVELLSPGFSEALDALLERDVPILGVVKGRGPASAMIQALGLSEEYRRQADRLWDRLSRDPDTLIWSCGKYDEKALALAAQWAREYCL